MNINCKKVMHVHNGTGCKGTPPPGNLQHRVGTGVHSIHGTATPVGWTKHRYKTR